MNDYQYIPHEEVLRRRERQVSDEVQLANAYAAEERQRQEAEERVERAAAEAEKRVSRSASESELHARVVRLADEAGEGFRVAAIRHLKSTHGTTQADYETIQRKLSKLLRIHKDVTGEDAGWRVYGESAR